MSKNKKVAGNAPRLDEVFIVTSRENILNVGSAYSLRETERPSLREAPPPPLPAGVSARPPGQPPANAGRFIAAAKQSPLRPDLAGPANALAAALDANRRIQLAAPEKLERAATAFAELLDELRNL